jgi:hypothetical protein
MLLVGYHIGEEQFCAFNLIHLILISGAVGTPIGAQDTNQSSEDWRSGYQDTGSELSIYIALIAIFQLGIR